MLTGCNLSICLSIDLSIFYFWSIYLWSTYSLEQAQRREGDISLVTILHSEQLSFSLSIALKEESKSSEEHCNFDCSSSGDTYRSFVCVVNYIQSDSDSRREEWWKLEKLRFLSRRQQDWRRLERKKWRKYLIRVYLELRSSSLFFPSIAVFTARLVAFLLSSALCS